MGRGLCPSLRIRATTTNAGDAGLVPKGDVRQGSRTSLGSQGRGTGTVSSPSLPLHKCDYRLRGTAQIRLASLS